MLLQRYARPSIETVVGPILDTHQSGDQRRLLEADSAGVQYWFLLGKPVESVEPDCVEIHERKLHSKDRALASDDKIAAMFMRVTHTLPSYRSR